MGTRFTILIGAFGLGYLALIFHLYDIQLAQGELYVVKAENQYAAQHLMVADRGRISFTDKNGNEVTAVSNKDFPFVYAVPKVVEDPSETAHLLSDVLQMDANDLVAQLSKKGDEYELLKKKVKPEIVDQIMNLGVKGIYTDTIAERFYPFDTLASQLLGFVSPNSKDPGLSGKYGLEEFYNDDLSGTSGVMQGTKFTAPKAGENLVLTIDPNIQVEAARILENTVTKYKATGGSVIVEDPKTGRILAMESYPHFDPNNYSASKLADFLNPTSQQIYEPGSVFKVITMAAGIDAGKITPETTYNDTGILELNDRKIRNWDLQAHGLMTMTNVIEKSLNTGAAFAEHKTGDKTFREYLEKFGFNDKTGIDLPGELKGDFRRLYAKDAPAVVFATASFGQGVAVTPLQMISAVGVLANDGVLMRPFINSDLKAQVVRRVIKPETASAVTKMMVSAVDKAEVAKIKGYSIAGKTGTAQVPDFKHGGYTDKFINTYIGFGPTKDPRFIVLIKLNEPEGSPLAGQTVVPAFRELAQFILNYYNIPPDRLSD